MKRTEQSPVIDSPPEVQLPNSSPSQYYPCSFISIVFLLLPCITHSQYSSNILLFISWLAMQLHLLTLMCEEIHVKST